MLRFRWITFDRFKVVNLSRFYRVNFIRPYWVNFTVFSTNAAGGNDYYESAVVNPDLLLRDLVKIFHPELVEEDFVYYKQLK